MRVFLVLIMGVAMMTVTQAAAAERIEMQLSTGGPVVIELKPDFAPLHVAQIKTLTERGFYDGLKFHRVIEGFMAQTGDPLSTGAGGSDMGDIAAEFSDYPYRRGTVGAARTADPDSANSQFFICFTDAGCGFLTGQYTVWGQVVEGMEHVDAVARGEPPAEPSTIVSMRVVKDAPPEPAAAAVPVTEVPPPAAANEKAKDAVAPTDEKAE
jgi:peptidylprolyl isomerase